MQVRFFVLAGRHRKLWNQYPTQCDLDIAAFGKIAEQGGQRVADSSGTTVPGTTAALAAGAAVAQSENGMTFGGGLSDLSLDDLQSLLGQMDSVRTLPSSDPSSMTPVLTVNEGGKSL